MTRSPIAMFEDDPLAHCDDILAPTLIVRGGNDRIIPDMAARQLARALPNARYMPLDSTAHAIEYTAPQLFVPFVLNFLRTAEVGV